MEAQQAGRMGARHLSQIQEEVDSRQHSTCVLPGVLVSMLQQQQTGDPGGPVGPGGPGESGRQVRRRLSDPMVLSESVEHQKNLEDNRSLLEELGHIEAELRESLRLDVERQQEAEFLRQQENKQLWKNLSYLSLNQRVAKPWVSSYFRKFPMHIYCLPVQAANHRGRRRSLKKKP